ncbi:MAG TPA: hypothetical protein VGE30_00335 [Candidatus Saccharimonadales bacterium]
MTHRRLDQTGFHIIPLLIIVLVIGVIGFAGWKVLSSSDDKKAPLPGLNAATPNNDAVRWAFDEQKLRWFTQTGKASVCKEPFRFDQTPVDLSKVLVIGMPGAYRGYNYKPHGGLRLASMESGAIEVRMPMDATLVNLTRYYEGSPAELQYLVTFESDCGIAFRFDHLQTLSPAFQKIAETTPEPKLNDTRATPNTSFARTKFKSGDIIATAVGFPRIKNFGFDFGVYDYRKPNAISNNKVWAALHNQYQSQEWFGTCWIESLPEAEVARAKQLSLVVVNPAKPNIISDYCTYAPHTTLDFNGGKPTDG